ncbi:hypothetical protein JZ751_008849 [Albula glossodonta]|uniref:VPS10 domain-containing protein n=1 Tax=Albula glossodonta TaxID=121402 RepID=A0A8T2NZD8_9TELE|nr:hypothetical protein JZ751_008849 [Albula glossodonta]
MGCFRCVLYTDERHIEDYGKTFHDISHVINNTFIRKEFGISTGPGNSQKVILSADVPALESNGGIIFTSVDAGVSFEALQLPFHPRQAITFHFQNPNYLVTISIDGAPRVIYVSSDQGHVFNKAQLPSATIEQFYSVLDGDEDMIFMHVDDPGADTYFGTIYTSDDRGILYSKSLERHLFGGEGKSDFTNITSLRGVYLTNVLEEDDRIRTVISFDRGGEWRLLSKPENAECGKNTKNCNLHIHGEYSRYNGLAPLLPLSDPSAVGLVIAHGSVGDSVTSAWPDVYVSDDGGYTWTRTLRGPHHYAILDSGGLVVAVESHTDRLVKTIKFSTDEGQCWKRYNFTEQAIFFAGLASEPGTKTMNLTIWGYRPEEEYRATWVAVTIDFQHLLTRDYTNGCVLGYKETFRRLKKQSVCRNGRDYISTVLVTVVAVSIMVVGLVAAIFLIVRRMLCTDRVPAYRFSALQLQEDDQCISVGPQTVTVNNRVGYQTRSAPFESGRKYRFKNEHRMRILSSVLISKADIMLVEGHFAFKMASGAASVVGPKICLEDNIVMSGVKNNVGRGINIALINGKTGELIKTDFFDMWAGDVNVLIKFLKTIEEGTVVMMATFDDSATKLNAEARKMIADLGSSSITTLGFRDNWIFVGGKGIKTKSPFEQHIKNNAETNKYEGWPEVLEMEGCIPARQE